MTPGRLAGFPALLHSAAQCARHHAIGSARAITHRPALPGASTQVAVKACFQTVLYSEVGRLAGVAQRFSLRWGDKRGLKHRATCRCS